MLDGPDRIDRYTSYAGLLKWRREAKRMRLVDYVVDSYSYSVTNLDA